MDACTSSALSPALDLSIPDDHLDADNSYLRAAALLKGSHGFQAADSRALHLWGTAACSHKHGLSLLKLTLPAEVDSINSWNGQNRAVCLYRGAIEASHTEAMFNLGSILFEGAEGWARTC